MSTEDTEIKNTSTAYRTNIGRTRKTRRRDRQSAFSKIRHPMTRIIIRYVMVGATFIFLAVNARNYYIGQIVLGEFSLGMPRVESAYAFGVADRVTDAAGSRWLKATRLSMDTASEWQYGDLNGSTITIHFSPETGLIDSITCFDPEAVTKQCFSDIGVSPGSSEEEVITKIGNPTSVTYSDSTKYLEYPELGLRIGLQKYTVKSVQLKNHKPESYAFITRYLRFIVP